MFPSAHSYCMMFQWQVQSVQLMYNKLVQDFSYCDATLQWIILYRIFAHIKEL